MNKTTTIIIIIFIIFFIGAIGAFFYITNQQDSVFAPERQGFFNTIFPFGGDKIPQQIQEEEIVDLEDALVTEIPKLRLISRESVAGSIVTLNKEDKEVVRYVERGTGHIIESQLDEVKTKRISNTTVPRIQEAFWSNDGEFVVLRYQNNSGDTESFLVDLSKTTESSLSGDFLDTNIKEVSFLDDYLFYQDTTSDNSTFVRGEKDGTNFKEVYVSPLKGFIAHWTGRTTAILSERPSGSLLGSAFSLNTVNSTLNRVVGPLRGLTLLPNQDKVLVGSRLDMFVLDSDETEPLFLRSLPEKCVWENKTSIYCSVPIFVESGLYPDDWYKGVIQFSDDIWHVNLENQQTNRLIELPEEAGENIDGINLILSPSGDYLIFKNKRNGSLWSLEIKSL